MNEFFVIKSLGIVLSVILTVVAFSVRSGKKINTKCIGFDWSLLAMTISGLSFLVAFCHISVVSTPPHAWYAILLGVACFPVSVLLWYGQNYVNNQKEYKLKCKSK